MKQLLKQALVCLNPTDLNNLTKEVKETIFLAGDTPANKAPFTSPELWRIQQFKRPVVIRRTFSL